MSLNDSCQLNSLVSHSCGGKQTNKWLLLWVNIPLSEADWSKISCLAGGRQPSVTGETISLPSPCIHLNVARTSSLSLHISVSEQRCNQCPCLPLYSACSLKVTPKSIVMLPFLFHNCLFFPSPVFGLFSAFHFLFFPFSQQKLSACLCGFCCSAHCNIKAFVGLPPLWCGETEMFKDKLELHGASFQKVAVHSKVTSQPEGWRSSRDAGQASMYPLVCAVLIFVAVWILFIGA